VIQVMPGTKVYLACRPVSMRYGFDGLAAQVKQVLAADPFSGHLFLFRSKRADYLKILYYDAACSGATCVQPRGCSARNQEAEGMRTLIALLMCVAGCSGSYENGPLGYSRDCLNFCLRGVGSLAHHWAKHGSDRMIGAASGHAR
jgi:IS66 Orf2 like protein